MGIIVRLSVYAGVMALICALLCFPVWAQEVQSQSVNPQDTFFFPDWEEGEDAPPPSGSALPTAHSIQSYGEDFLPEAQTSALEALYAQRIDERLEQFGYGVFKQSPQDKTAPSMGMVQDSYVLGVGDELRIIFSGQRNTRETVKIDHAGLLLISDFPPITAAGQSLAQVHEELKAAAAGLHNTEVFVTLGALRQIGVLVVGNVERPGRRILTAFDTPLDALMASSGVRKDGSLRQIKLIRAGQSQIVDLYDILLHGGVMQDVLLKDGDRIVVPPIGATVALAGAVKRPGIFEIRSDPFKGLSGQSQNRISLRQMLSLGGGVLSAGQNRFLHLSAKDTGYDLVQEVTDQAAAVFGDGSVLLVARGQEKKTAQIQLVGETRKPGFFDLTRYKTLSALLKDAQVLGEDIYPLIGVIARWDPERLTTTYIDYPVRAVLKKEKDVDLKDSDKIILFSNADISKVFQEKNNETERIENLQKKGQSNDFHLSHNSALYAFLKERVVTLRGAVRQPGLYPAASGITLDDLLATAGGLARDADQSGVEITPPAFATPEPEASPPERLAASWGAPEDAPAKADEAARRVIDLLSANPRDIVIAPGSAIRIAQKFRKIEEKGVLIAGEVHRPGRYDLAPEDKISDLIARAGGMTAQAYPLGAVFSRESERRAEESRFRAAKQDIERSLAAALQREKNPPDTAQIEMVRALADELGSVKALGRITMEADPDVLTLRPDKDMLLEAGDRLYIPKRPLTVRVSGEVLSPASLQFEQDKDPRDYIREAGGFTYHADKERSFVLFPDGSAQPLHVTVWSHEPIKIPPGSSIIVPRDPKPFDFIESAKDVTQILSNLAVTSILIDDLQE